MNSWLASVIISVKSFFGITAPPPRTPLSRPVPAVSAARDLRPLSAKPLTRKFVRYGEAFGPNIYFSKKKKKYLYRAKKMPTPKTPPGAPLSGEMPIVNNWTPDATTPPAAGGQPLPKANVSPYERFDLFPGPLAPEILDKIKYPSNPFAWKFRDQAYRLHFFKDARGPLTAREIAFDLELTRLESLRAENPEANQLVSDLMDYLEKESSDAPDHHWITDQNELVILDPRFAEQIIKDPKMQKKWRRLVTLWQDSVRAEEDANKL